MAATPKARQPADARRRTIGRIEGDRHPPPPQVFAYRRPPATLTEQEAVAIAGTARPLGELHGLFHDSHTTRPAKDTRGPYRRRR